MRKKFFISSAKFFALICVLMLSVGNAWGATKITATCNVHLVYTGTVPEGDFGKVYVAYKTGTTQTAPTTEQWQKANHTVTKDNISSSNTAKYFHCYAEGLNGYQFKGWYTDATCETEAPNNFTTSAIYDYMIYSNSPYIYRFIPNADHTIDLYAKFAKEASNNKFRANLTVSSANADQGLVNLSNSGVDMYGTGILYFDESKKGTYPNPSKSLTGTLQQTPSTDTFEVFYVYAEAMRGYEFAGWTPGEGVELASEFYCADSWCYSSAFKVNVDNTATKTDGVYIKNGTLIASFSEMSTTGFTIQKEEGKGTVSVSATYRARKNDSSEKTTINLEGMSSSEMEKIYSNLYSTDEITLTAIHADGYEFEGWFVNDPWMGEYLYDDNETTTVSIYTDGITFTPRFHISKDQLHLTENDKFLVGFSACQTFEQALAAATNSTSKTILQLQDYTISRGNYTIPEGVSLVITKNEDQTRADGDNVELSSATNVTPSAYCTLTLENGANLDVYGTIEVSGTQNVNGQGVNGVGHPHGAYGKLVMKQGSHITINSGAKLYAWGFITGDGTTDADGNYLSGDIDVRRNGEVREQFQMMDWKGGTRTSNMLNNAQKVFPVNQYFIQNVEVPATYRPGSRLYGATGVNVAGGEIKANVQIMGISYGEDDPRNDIAMFLMDNTDESEDTWVRKRYDAKNDLQVYEVNNSAHLGSITIGLAGYVMTSTDYILPLTNNMKIHLLSGNMDITQDVELLPGAELEIDKQCTFNISTGKKLYVYDAAEWGGYAYSGYYGHQVLYTAVHGDKPNKRAYTMQSVATDASKKPAAAAINIHGTLEVRGGIYTTASGANVFSSIADAGTVVFLNNAVAAAKVYQTTAADETPTYDDGADCTSAQLKNGVADSFEPTTDVVADNNNPITYCYLDMNEDGNGEWVSLTEEDCFVKDGSTYYIKPRDYVALKSEIEDPNTHLYYSTDETRTFISTLDRDGNCQWWEVKPVEGGLMHCIHPDNDVYYFYDEDSESDTYETWQEKRFNVTFKNWDGTKLTFINTESQVQDHYELRYGSMPQWYGSNPTRDTDPGYYTYDFIGWYPVLSPVTADVEYTAQYEKKPVLYAITFNDADGNLIEVTYCRRDEMPVCQRHTLADGEHWEPALGLVTGEKTYQLSTDTKTDNFTIQFVNWNGDILHTEENVPNTTDAAGVAALYTATPEKTALGTEEEYTFAGWTPEITAATADAVYTATFTVKTIAPLTIINQQTIADEREVSELIVTTSGTLNVTGSVTATNFILESNGNMASGQLLGATNVTATNAYFDYKVNADDHNWYAVAVPWLVDATNGISVNGRTLVLGKDFDIIYYSGERRASEGKQKCWSYVEDDGDKTLVPGRLYMIGLMGDASTVRFAKKADANLLTTTTSVTAYASANAGDANWNGVANPALFHAFVNPGATAGQIYNSANKSYEPFLLNEKKLVVGQGVYVQAPNTINPLTVSYGGAYAAPRRERAEANTLFDVRIAPAGASRTDRLFVTIDEDKEEDVYVIGKDLAKVGVSKKVAQMWVARYNTELCMNTIAPVNGVAEYPLGISVPANGEYTISNVQSPMSDEAYTLYLTLNGEAIWDLSDAPYTLDLTKGTTNAYGLRISAKAPQVVTGVDEAVVDAKGETRKVLINNQVFIIRGNEVYTIDGQLVK